MVEIFSVETLACSCVVSRGALGWARFAHECPAGHGEHDNVLGLPMSFRMLICKHFLRILVKNIQSHYISIRTPHSVSSDICFDIT